MEAPDHTLIPSMIDCHVHLMEHSIRLEDRLMTRPSLKYFHAASTFGDEDLRSLYVTTSDGLVFRARGEREGLLLFPPA